MKKHIHILWIVIFTWASVSSASAIHPDQVSVSERQLLVNGIPYLIKGVCYNPVPKGSNSRSFENLSQDLDLMKAAGINTIRVYSPIDDKGVLDQIHEAGLKGILGFG